MVTLPGVRFTAFPWTSFADRRKNSLLSPVFTTHSSSSRKIFAGQSCGPRFPSFEVNTSKQVEIKPSSTRKVVPPFSRSPLWNGRTCKSRKLTLLCHSGVGSNITRRVASSDNQRKKSLKSTDSLVLTSPSHSHLKFILMVGFLTLQSTQQAIAGSDIGSRLQSISFLGDLGDISTGFASAFLLIFFSELGDKTFFIAALLAARNSAAVVFLGTFGALAIMTVISVFLGRTFHFVDGIVPFRIGDTELPIDDLAAVCLLVYFGVSSLIEASSGDSLKAEEEQKEAELAVSELSGSGAGILAAANTIFSTFLLVFVAEWGDKSFFSTIALAAASSPLGVIAGALAGHGAATLVAVLGGSFLGTYLSEKVIAYIGGSLFLVFAAVTLVEIFT